MHSLLTLPTSPSVRPSVTHLAGVTAKKQSRYIYRYVCECLFVCATAAMVSPRCRKYGHCFELAFIYYYQNQSSVLELISITRMLWRPAVATTNCAIHDGFCRRFLSLICVRFGLVGLHRFKFRFILVLTFILFLTYTFLLSLICLLIYFGDNCVFLFYNLVLLS